jgi:thiamine biosynthesis lipoprotein
MKNGASHQIWVICQIAQIWWLAPFWVAAAELPTLAGPAMGTTYRVTLAADIPGMTSGEVHRDVEAVLARIDRASSTWRNDSDASRFNRAAAGEWVAVSKDLVTLVETAREIHEQSEGAFDITVGPAGSGRPTGMRHVVSQLSPPALRKSVPGIAIDLGGIGPGYAVDRIGERLVSLGSKAHLVELGGEVRAWGQPSKSRPWRVRLTAADAGQGHSREIDLADGEAVATSTCRPGRSPIDPRTGRPVTASRPRRAATVRATTCAAADAWAVAAIVLDLTPDRDGTLTMPEQLRSAQGP